MAVWKVFCALVIGNGWTNFDSSTQKINCWLSTLGMLPRVTHLFFQPRAWELGQLAPIPHLMWPWMTFTAMTVAAHHTNSNYSDYAVNLVCAVASMLGGRPFFEVRGETKGWFWSLPARTTPTRGVWWWQYPIVRLGQCLLIECNLIAMILLFK